MVQQQTWTGRRITKPDFRGTDTIPSKEQKINEEKRLSVRDPIDNTKSPKTGMMAVLGEERQKQQAENLEK